MEILQTKEFDFKNIVLTKEHLRIICTHAEIPAEHVNEFITTYWNTPEEIKYEYSAVMSIFSLGLQVAAKIEGVKFEGHYVDRLTIAYPELTDINIDWHNIKELSE